MAMDRYRVLVVDDEVEICALFKSSFLRQNCDVIICNSGSDALNLFKKSPPFHALLTDIRMPGELTGIDLVQKVKSFLKLGNLKIKYYTFSKVKHFKYKYAKNI